MKRGLSRAFRNGFLRLEGGLSSLVDPEWNPFLYLGALAFFSYWIAAASGIYLYIFFDTSVSGAYPSVEYLTNDQWWLGGFMRSFHRYSSDAMVPFMFLHLGRELAMGRFRAARAFSWITGVVVIAFVYASGISGFWLVWDKLAQYVAIKTFELLDWMPIFGEPLARNFLAPGSMDDRFFSLLVFLHVAIPLFLLLALWVHLQRITKPAINPPKPMIIAYSVLMLGLTVVVPVASEGPADLALMVQTVRLDWYYLSLYPLLDFIPAGMIWAGAAIGTILLVGVPWLPPKERAAKAIVHLNECNGCERCALDCPYSAITMVGRSDGKPFSLEAQVNESLCVSCGICMGACPTAMPHRRMGDIQAGIELGDLGVMDLREQVRAKTAALDGERRVVVFGCDFGSEAEGLASNCIAAISLPCIGALPPSFIDYVLRKGLADGVMVAGCDSCACQHRFGTEWTAARLNRTRDPYLRRRVPDERLRIVWTDPFSKGKLADKLNAFLEALDDMPKTRFQSTLPTLSIQEPEERERVS